MTVWDLQKVISRRLLVWGGLSVAVGVSLLTAGIPFWLVFGVQALLWGGISAAIALIGRWSARRRHDALNSPLAADHLAREERSLRGVLWGSVALGVLLVVGGVVLALTVGGSDATWRGHGWAVVLEGAFLFLFSLIHVWSVPVSVQVRTPLRLDDPRHTPFYWRGPEPAALLVHGFGGSAYDMRALGRSLHAAGWSVRGILLPGFGPQISAMGQQRSEDWLEAVETVLVDLARDHRPLLLVGHSMGGALSIAAASSHSVDGLVLLAPFWRLATPLQRSLLKALRPVLPRDVRPFQRIDLSKSPLKSTVGRYMPKIDLDDPGTQSHMRQLRVSPALLEQVDGTGLHAYQLAPGLDVPILVIQGLQDTVVRPKYTRRLVERLGSQARYIEVEASHDITFPDQVDWPKVEEAVLGFAESVLQAHCSGAGQ